MADHLREAVLHSLVAALVVEAVLRLWRVHDGALKLRLRLFVVVLPLVLLPAFEALAPFRHDTAFADGAAVFVFRRWEALTVLGVGVAQLFLYALGGLGVGLVVMDLVPFFKAWRRQRAQQLPTLPADAGLERQVAELSRALRLNPPAVQVVDADAALLFCRSARRPALVVSRATLERLDPKELQAALAHELAHVAHHDVWLGWALSAARLLQAWNPVAQLVARAVTLDVERRADDTAAALTGDRLALASGLISMFRASAARAVPDEALLHGALRRARESTIEHRCRRLMQPPVPAPRFAPLLLGATVLSVSTLTFFIT